MMKEVMMQLQMDIPSLETDASVTATLKNEENVLMDLESVLHLPAASYQQKASLKYGIFCWCLNYSGFKTLNYLHSGLFFGFSFLR